MKSEEQLKFSDNVVIIPVLLIFIMWFIYWLEIKLGWNFNKYGVYPRSFKGLRGVLLSPFIHADAKHLFNNSIPLFVLTSSLLYFYNKVSVKVLLLGGFLTGLFTWLIARESYHIGASGIVYLLFSFIFFSGVIKKHYRLVTLSLVVIFLYGSMIWYILPIKEGMSWEGHLSGFSVGLIFSIIYRKEGLVKEKYHFSKTEFDDMFDEQGNYIPPVVEELLEDNDFNNINNSSNLEEEKPEIKQINYNYIYKEKEE